MVHPVRAFVEVDAFRGDVRGDEDAELRLFELELLDDPHDLHVAHRAVDELHVLGLESADRFHDVRLQPLCRGDGFREDDDAVPGVLLVPATVLLEILHEVGVLGEVVALDLLGLLDQIGEEGDVRRSRTLPLQLRLAVVCRGDKSGGTGQERLHERGAEHRLRATLARVHLERCPVEGPAEHAFWKRVRRLDRNEPAFREIRGDLVGDMLLETTLEQVFDVVHAVAGRIRDRKGIEERHQRGEAFARTVVRRGREEDHVVAAVGKLCRETVALRVAVLLRRHVVCFVDDHHVPAGVLKRGLKLVVLLEGVDRDDGLVVVVERVVVGRNVLADALEAGRVETHQRNGETAPHLLLELGHHGLQRHHENALGGAAHDKLGKEDSRLKRLAEADGISYEDARPGIAGRVERMFGRLQLVVHHVHRRVMGDGDRIGRNRILAQERLDPKACFDTVCRRVELELGVLRANDLDSAPLGTRPEDLVAPLHRARDAAHIQSLPSGLHHLDLSDKPFRIADSQPHARAVCFLALHAKVLWFFAPHCHLFDTSPHSRYSLRFLNLQTRASCRDESLSVSVSACFFSYFSNAGSIAKFRGSWLVIRGSWLVIRGSLIKVRKQV